MDYPHHHTHAWKGIVAAFISLVSGGVAAYTGHTVATAGFGSRPTAVLFLLVMSVTLAVRYAYSAARRRTLYRRAYRMYHGRESG